MILQPANLGAQMKSFIVLFSILSASIASADQRFGATQPGRSTGVHSVQLLTANIQSAQMDPRREGFNEISNGTVQIDVRFRRNLTLTLNPAFHCPRGRFCAAVMPAPIVFSLPLVSVQR